MASHDSGVSSYCSCTSPSSNHSWAITCSLVSCQYSWETSRHSWVSSQNYCVSSVSSRHSWASSHNSSSGHTWSSSHNSCDSSHYTWVSSRNSWSYPDHSLASSHHSSSRYTWTAVYSKSSIRLSFHRAFVSNASCKCLGQVLFGEFYVPPCTVRTHTLIAS